MNSGSLRTIVFIIIGVLILGIFLKVLPYIIIGGIAIYLITKGYNYIKLNFNKERKSLNREQNTYNSRVNNNFEDDEFDTSNAIDVDFKDAK